MIKNLQALRFVFIMMIVFSHLIGKTFDFGGECGVSFFFILSGFVLSYAYGKQIQAGTFHQKGFLLKQLSKFYPLHIVMFFIMILLDARIGDTHEWYKLVAQFFLLQSWVPSDTFYFVCNGVSWFLCNMVFFYVVFPKTFLLLMNSSHRQVSLMAVIILVLYAVLAVSIPERFINPVLYVAPWTRLLDFSIGILLFRFYASSVSRNVSKWLACRTSFIVTLLELLMVLTVVMSFFIYEHASLRFRCAALFWFVIPLFLYVFMMTDKQTGGVSLVLRSSLLQWLGGISLEIFLTHIFFMRVCYSGLSSWGIGETDRQEPMVLLLTLFVIILGSYFIKRYFVSPIYSNLIKRIS